MKTAVQIFILLTALTLNLYLFSEDLSFIAPNSFINSLLPINNQILQVSEDFNIELYNNPRDLSHFDTSLAGTILNPVEISIKAYRNTLKKSGFDPLNSRTIFAVQGSYLYATPFVADDLDLQIFHLPETEKEIFAALFREELKKELEKTFRDKNKEVSLTLDPRFEVSAQDIYISIKDKSSNDQENMFFNICFSDWDSRPFPETIYEQSMNMTCKSYFNIEIKPEANVEKIRNSRITIQDYLKKLETTYVRFYKAALMILKNHEHTDIFMVKNSGKMKKFYLDMLIKKGHLGRFYQEMKNQKDLNNYQLKELEIYLNKSFKVKSLKKILELAQFVGKGELLNELYSHLSSGSYLSKQREEEILQQLAPDNLGVLQNLFYSLYVKKHKRSNSAKFNNDSELITKSA